jgi:hypothetical protein
VQELDAAAGNRYYQAQIIEQLEKVKDASQEEIEELIRGYGYCEADSDCVGFYGDCPFGCGKAVNAKFLGISQQLIAYYRETQAALGNPQCVYSCVEMEGVKCENSQCVVQFKTPDIVE